MPRNGADQQRPCTDSTSYCNAASYQPAFPSNGAVYPCAGSDLNTPPTAGCANGYVVNETLASGTMLGAGTVTARRGGFYNNRERAWVWMLNVNVHDLLVWNRTQASGAPLFNPDDTTDGGLVIFLGVESNEVGIPSRRPRGGTACASSDRRTSTFPPAWPIRRA